MTNVIGEGQPPTIQIGFADAIDRPDGYMTERRPVGSGETIEQTIRPCGGYVALIKGK